MADGQELKGKVAVVGGGAKNLGGRLSVELARRGAAVMIHYHSDSARPEADAAVAAIRGGGGRAESFQGDLSKPRVVAALFDEAVKAFGGVDLAVNTTGVVIKKPIHEVTEEDYDRSFNVNSKAAFFFIKEAGRTLNDRGKICTIVTSLLAGYTDSYSIYAGAKSPIEHFTRAASKEFGPRGISVTALGPGPMETPFFYGQETPESAAYNQSAAALSKFTKTGLTDVEDVVPIVLFLLADGWWITGQTIFCNGGYTSR
ncbi:SDR family oxidoreductase [Paludisphaera rhizosphaerae]|uniref:SDR family oxidoreductase n=1 Tax=Paludisphaera rhizosphaerae TaxID=2711216 RepID=UPI0013EB60E1|nr:SDR family oxidoreductase [Paludisphaera rhizosphaerae]